jgi:hypothetical protein
MTRQRTRAIFSFCARSLFNLGAPMLALVGHAVAADVRFGAEPDVAESEIDQPPPALVTDWNTTFVDNVSVSGTIGAFATWDDGSGTSLYAGGHYNSFNNHFTSAGGIATHWVGRWNGVGWSALGNGLNGPVREMVVHDGELVVAGTFTVAGGVPVQGIARWDGHRWAGFAEGVSAIGAIISFQGELIVSATLTRPDGSMVWGFARWTGNEWAEMDTSLNQPAYAMLDYDGVLVAAGNFRTSGANPIRHVAQWTGTQWEPIGAGLPAVVTELAVHQGDLVAAGTFSLGFGATLTRVAGWNGSTWSGVGNLNQAEALASFNGELIAGGGVSGNGDSVFRWDGQGWIPLTGLDHFVNALAVHEGKLVAAAFGSDVPVSHWDGSAWSPIGANFDTGVESLFVHRGQLIAGGSFRRAGDLESPYLIGHGPAQTTQTVIEATTPEPSAPGQPVQIRVRVTGVEAPAVGHVTLTGTGGGSCTDLTLESISAVSVRAECTILWNTACPRMLVANYVGGSDGVATWQSSKSEPVLHRVEGAVECELQGVFADGYE